ncbi:biotin--[acetyl-CoA-carboxylase] ligase [Alkalibacter mobilis]|uniref:biotin--[acetyl-CoA-carboxylase] ligase n=1 Tax=Alkalibacter mobilis TaxID=2787712 RepID=UPI0018A0101E|nr:biotin--[acetyl-CoA-carboxylase] ligase [Alkalibacter mobilis]MBF7096414.1 biotin--[acetyl-CoA-carboxylase] ligase [Alkalibacter mobilis]
MTNREKILEFFELNPGKVFSGEELAVELGITRSAVWKNIKKLAEDGHPVVSLPNKGYYLEYLSDILSETLIGNNLNTKKLGKVLYLHKSVESTNDMLKQLAKDGASEGTAIISEEQLKGKGRRGKTFFSPKGQGIYMSILLRPKSDPAQSLSITVKAAVAASRTIEEFVSGNVQIKWVNDVFVDGRKVAGILTEASLEMESGTLEYVIVGIGINVTGKSEDLPNEIKDTAAFMSESAKVDLNRNEIAARFLNNFEDIYYNDEFDSVIEEYREKSYLTGKDVVVIRHDGNREGTVLGIENNGGLLVRYENGDTGILDSGEVSVRKR